VVAGDQSLSAKGLFFGDVSKAHGVRGSLNGANGTGWAACIQYNYRNLPYPKTYCHGDWDGCPWKTDYERRWSTLKYTRPAQLVVPGCPPFKTAKALAGRALVVDSFSKPYTLSYGHSGNDPDKMGVNMGMGQFAHKDGYNVLYGDGHVSWYGDPQQQLIWMNHGLAVNHFYSLAITMWDSNYAGKSSDDPPFTSVVPYHMFDLAAGIDLEEP